MPKLNEYVCGLGLFAIFSVSLNTEAITVQDRASLSIDEMSESNHFSEMKQGAALRQEAKTLLTYAKKHLLNANQMNKTVLAISFP